MSYRNISQLEQQTVQQGSPLASIQDGDLMSNMPRSECEIVPVGKRRDGGTRYWCLFHKANATAKYGKPAPVCCAAHVPPISSKDMFSLNIDKYPGGIALWGAVPPVYDTTTLPMDRGIHVHARKIAGGKKCIDRTSLSVRISGEHIPGDGILISEIDAIYYMVTSIFGYEMRDVRCTHCGHPHLDRDWFSVHPHRRHLCAGCGKHFPDSVTAIGNPICGVRNAYGFTTQKPLPATESLCIRQSEYPGGIQIWGSNPAFIWNSELPEREGIHVHAFDGNSRKPAVDETFQSVTIDGVELDAAMVRILMAQMTLPSLKDRVVTINCSSCAKSQYSLGDFAFTPIMDHTCDQCGCQTKPTGRRRKVIANPLVGILEQLAKGAPRQPQMHDLGLMPETL